MSYWRMVKGAPCKGIDTITERDMLLVREHWEKCHKNKHRLPARSVSILFGKYHEYVSKSPADQACGACVQVVYNYWKQQITKWNALD